MCPVDKATGKSSFSYTPLTQGGRYEDYAPDEAEIEGDEEAEQLEGFFGTVSDHRLVG